MRNWERYKIALELRRSGKTYREIGNTLNVSVERARQMVATMEREERRPPRWYEGLDNALGNWLTRNGIRSANDLRNAVVSGRLLDTTQVGKKSYRKIIAWLSSRGPNLGEQMEESNA